jgi:hypothetical protein
VGRVGLMRSWAAAGWVGLFSFFFFFFSNPFSNLLNSKLFIFSNLNFNTNLLKYFKIFRKLFQTFLNSNFQPLSIFLIQTFIPIFTIIFKDFSQDFF